MSTISNGQFFSNATTPQVNDLHQVVENEIRNNPMGNYFSGRSSLEDTVWFVYTNATESVQKIVSEAITEAGFLEATLQPSGDCIRIEVMKHSIGLPGDSFYSYDNIKDLFDRAHAKKVQGLNDNVKELMAKNPMGSPFKNVQKVEDAVWEISTNEVNSVQKHVVEKICAEGYLVASLTEQGLKIRIKKSDASREPFYSRKNIKKLFAEAQSKKEDALQKTVDKKIGKK